AKVIAQVFPGGVLGSSLRHEHSHNAFLAEASKTLAVAEDLAEAEPKLLFLVFVCDALDLGDKDCSFCLPCEIEVWLAWLPGPRFDAGPSQDLCQLVLSVGMPLETAFDKSWIDCEWLSIAWQWAYLGFSVCYAKRWCRDGTVILCAWRRRHGRCDERRERLNEFRGQLVEIGLLGPGLGAAV